jgi:uncharacterized DUF497 family protein
MEAQMLLFEWDRAKSAANRVKHGIDFETARLVFEDPISISFVERVTDGEERWQTIGSIEGLVVIVVAHTYRAEAAREVVRIISARRATRRERGLYEQSHG